MQANLEMEQRMIEYTYAIEPSGVSEISVGFYHSLYLKSDGSLWVWDLILMAN